MLALLGVVGAAGRMDAGRGVCWKWNRKGASVCARAVTGKEENNYVLVARVRLYITEGDGIENHHLH